MLKVISQECLSLIDKYTVLGALCGTLMKIRLDPIKTKYITNII